MGTISRQWPRNWLVDPTLGEAHFVPGLPLCPPWPLHWAIFFVLFFDMDQFLKSLLNALQYCFCFMFWFFDRKTCGILVLCPGIKSPPPALEDGVLTTGPPGKTWAGSFAARFGKHPSPRTALCGPPREGRLNGLFPTLTPINFFGNISSPFPPCLHHPSGETLFWGPLTSVSRASQVAQW